MRIFIFLTLLFCGSMAQAFCGFYVAKAEGSLYNQSSKVVFTRDRGQSIITMSSDYRGAAKDFAMIIPTPKVLKRDQIRTVKSETVDHLDSYTAPRLVEYFDHDPCSVWMEPAVVMEDAAPGLFGRRNDPEPIYKRADALGVKIKGKYAVGTYDILILAAQQSDGLTTFLTSEGYKLPAGAEDVLADYISKGMKFFVARVNLDRHNARDTQELPPLQIRFRSAKFMLPIQLGKLNAAETQDALFFMLTRRGRVQSKNYEVTSLTTDVTIPSFVEKEFGDFYRAMFNKTAPKMGGIVMEYAWDMQWCDPCAADPLSREELEELGVFWLKDGNSPSQVVFVTRLHAQYSKDQMPQDIVFQTTNDKENFQGRYVMNQPFTGPLTCQEGKDYLARTKSRLRRDAANLSELTGWSQSRVHAKVKASVPRGYW